MKLLVSDFDNTLFVKDNISKDDLNSIKKYRDKGNKFVIATGRSYFDLMCEIENISIPYDYLIINHGNTLINKENEVVFSHCMDNKLKNDLINTLDLYNNPPLFCCKGKDSRVDITENNLSKIHIVFKTNELAYKTCLYVNEKYKNKLKSYYISRYKAVEIIGNDFDKSKMIDKIARIDNIKKDEIYTIGDGMNDIDMIKKYNGACMSTSCDEVKINSNLELHTVSEYIDIILNEEEEKYEFKQ